jgi:hypothetical protein
MAGSAQTASAAALPREAVSAAAWAALAALLIACTAGFVSFMLLPVNGDVSWLLVVCGRLLDGAQLNIDMIEVNPPFSIWLYMPYALLERLVGGAAELWMTAGVVGTALASLAISCRMLSRGEPAYHKAWAMTALPVIAFTVLCLFPEDFGQREQWALIALLPWVALQCIRQRHQDFAAPARWQVVLAGICAGIAVMIKPPHFALALMLPSACLAVYRRSWKPLFVFENLLGAAIAAAYVVSILLFEPFFVTKILPLAGELYLPLRQPFLDLLTDWPQTVLLLAMLTVIMAGGPRLLHWDATVPLLSAFGFLTAYMVMGKGWPNHAWPMLMLAIAGFILQLLRTENIKALTLVRKASAVIGCLVVLKVAVAIQISTSFDDHARLQQIAAVIGDSVERPSVVSLAARLPVAHPLVRIMDADFVSRYPSAWAAYNADLLAHRAADPDTRQRLATIRDRLIKEFAAEIMSRQPDIVLYSAETGPRWDELVLRNERIAAALQDYKVLFREPNTTVYIRASAMRGKSAEARE